MRALVFAHRGASKLAPENTMPAFELAYQMGADGIETDVQLTKDRIPVLIHDENVRRTTNGTGFVQDYTLKELQQLDAGSWFSSEFSNVSILSLEELLRWLQGKNLTVNLELKTNIIEYKNIEQIVHNLVGSYNLLNQTVISSFNANTISRFKQIGMNTKTAFLTSQKRIDLIDYAKELGVDGIHVRYRLLNRSLIEEAHRQGLYVAVYTVNRPSHIFKCYKIGCDAVITDVPHLANQGWEKFQQKHL